MEYMKLPQASKEKLIARLAAMPAFLGDSFARLPSATHVLSGPQGSFSPVEQVWHLADLEVMGFAERIRRLLSESYPFLPDFLGDEVARERDYKSLSLLEGIDAFRRSRQANLAALGSLTDEEWNRSGEQEGIGPVSLCDLPSMMAAHDESHRLEIGAWLNHASSGNGGSST